MVSIENIIMRFARNTPVLHVVLCAISSIYPFNWFDAGNLIGHSMLVSFFYIVVCLFCKEFKHYRYPFVFSLGMFFMSFIDHQNDLFNYKGTNEIIYDVGTLIVCLALALLLINKPKIKTRLNKI